MENINVLFITNYADMYGANRSMVDLIKGLRNYGIIPTVLINGNEGKLGEELRKQGVSVISHEFRITSIYCSIKFKWFRKLTRRIMRMKEYKQIYSFIKDERLSLDVIHSNTSILEIGYYLSVKLKKPHIWHIREFGTADYDLESIFSKNELYGKYQKSSIITISKAIDEYVKNEYGNIKTHQIYDDIEITEPYLKNEYKSEKVRFAIVGAIRRKKGQMDVVCASKRLIEHGCHNFELHIIGEDRGIEASRIKEYVEKNKLTDHIVFDGHQSNVNEILKSMDCGITASHCEALGRVTIEYMANYMFTIGSKSGGTAELIGDMGLLYESGDIEQLSECMYKYMLEKDELDKKSLLWRKRAEEFANGECSEKISKIYRTCLRC